MLKKMMAAVLSCAMIFALAVPAMAALDLEGETALGSSVGTTAGSDDGYAMDITTKMNVVTLDLEVTGTPYIVLNPYALEIPTATLLNSGASSAQVVGADLKFVNKSEAAVIIGVKDLKGVPSSNVTLATKSLATDTKTVTKSVFIYVSMAKDLATARKQALNSTTDGSGTFIVPAAEKTKANLYKIAAKGNTTGTEAHMTFCGDAISAPAEAWVAADNVQVTFHLTAKLAT